jgi:hypothetical protein
MRSYSEAAASDRFCRWTRTREMSWRRGSVFSRHRLIPVLRKDTLAEGLVHRAPAFETLRRA